MTLSIRNLTPEDLPAALALSRGAGWNQTEADWLRMIALEPEGAFLAVWSGAPAGTVLACIHGRVAWIAMMLVDEKLRRRGIGANLMRHALAFLNDRGVRCVRLDATPVGQPLYELLGFRAEYVLARHAGVPVQLSGPAAEEVEPARQEDTEQILALDRRVTGADRSKFLLRLLAEHSQDVRVVRDGAMLAGYSATRPGARAQMIGPCLGDSQAGPLLISEALRLHAGKQVYLDVPVGRTKFEQLLQERGLTAQRFLQRMVRGESAGERSADLWASSGPEKG
jgi:predicted N-acetyltransferase YhbS